VRVLDRVIGVAGTPESIRIDNGPEFAGQLLDRWAAQHQVTLDFTTPGKPTKNGHSESFNSHYDWHQVWGRSVIPLTKKQLSQGESVHLPVVRSTMPVFPDRLFIQVVPLNRPVRLVASPLPAASALVLC
jgi:transposase InsO family protein